MYLPDIFLGDPSETSFTRMGFGRIILLLPSSLLKVIMKGITSSSLSVVSSVKLREMLTV